MSSISMSFTSTRCCRYRCRCKRRHAAALTSGDISTTPQTVHSLLATWAAVVPTGLLTQPSNEWTTSITASVCVHFVRHPSPWKSYDPLSCSIAWYTGAGRAPEDPSPSQRVKSVEDEAGSVPLGVAMNQRTRTRR